MPGARSGAPRHDHRICAARLCQPKAESDWWEGALNSHSVYQRQEITRAFGLTLKALRKAGNLYQDRLADLCDFDITYPSLLERGLRSQTLIILIRLADALNVHRACLIIGTAERLRQL